MIGSDVGLEPAHILASGGQDGAVVLHDVRVAQHMVEEAVLGTSSRRCAG